MTLLACSASSSISAYGFTFFLDGRGGRPSPQQHAMSASVRGMGHHHTRRRPTLFMSNDQHYDNLPSLDEISQQKREAYAALSSYHETSSSSRQGSSPLSSSQVVSLLMRDLEDIGLGEEESSVKRAECWKCHNGSVRYAVSAVYTFSPEDFQNSIRLRDGKLPYVAIIKALWSNPRPPVGGYDRVQSAQIYKEASKQQNTHLRDNFPTCTCMATWTNTSYGTNCHSYNNSTAFATRWLSKR